MEKLVKLSELKVNPRNPQKFDDLSKLEKSIKEFSKMMELRPMIVDTDNMVLGGNKRLICLQNLGFEEIPTTWVKKASELTEDEKKRFIIADNVGFGEWDFEILKEDFDFEFLDDWGVQKLQEVVSEVTDFSSKNKELDVTEFSDKMLLKFELTEEEYHFVMDKLNKENANKEIALLKLLNYGT